MKKKNNIVLIGFMGAGKSTVAKALYKETGIFPIDCDDMIESVANLKIKEIFDKFGEETFRQLENDLAKFLFENVNNSIISTGGGFYKIPNLKYLGTVIYLKSNFDEIIKRIQNNPNSKDEFQKRPLFSNLEKAKQLYEKREEKYKKKSDFIINTKDKSPKEIAKEIKKIIKDKI